MTKYVILGAGSIGCYVGGMMAAGGSDVVMLGRERLLGVLQEYGLKISDNEAGGCILSPDELQYTTDASALSEADVIFVCVKSMGTEDAATQIAKHAPQSAAIVSLQNGVSNAPTLREALPDHKVLAGMVPYNVVNLGNGHFHKGTSGAIVIEESDEGVYIMVDMVRTHLDVTLSDDIEGVLWGKVLINMNNAINMLSNRPLREELLTIGYRRVWAACIKEGMAVLKAANIKPLKSSGLDPVLFSKILGLPNFILLRVAKGLARIDEKARSSMWEDLQQGRAPEIDYINGEIIRLGREVGVATPVNDKIVELVKHSFAEGRSPAIPGDELYTRVR